MASYFIIGGDTKEYGPISADDINLWITEGRLSAQSLARSDSDTAWRTLGSFPEFGPAFKATPSSLGSLAPSATDYLDRDYELDIGGCITGGWELLKNNFGTLFGGFLAVIAIIVVASFIINGLGSLILPTNPVLREGVHLLCVALLAPITGPLIAGLYLLFIRVNRNQAASVGDVFAGFQNNFKDLFLGNLAVTLAIGLCMAPYNMVNDAKLLPITTQMQHTTPDQLQSLLPQFWSALFASLPVFFICLIPVTYLMINWQFTLPLILDKQMPFWPAMKTSWKMVHKHWLQVFGLYIVVGLVCAGGILACCIGIIVTIPIGIGAMMIAYETIFGSRKT